MLRFFRDVIGVTSYVGLIFGALLAVGYLLGNPSALLLVWAWATVACVTVRFAAVLGTVTVRQGAER